MTDAGFRVPQVSGPVSLILGNAQRECMIAKFSPLNAPVMLKGSGYIPSTFGSSPPSKVQKEASNASSRLLNDAPENVCLRQSCDLDRVTRETLTLDYVTNLVKRHWLSLAHKRHGVFKIEIGLSIRPELLVDHL